MKNILTIFTMLAVLLMLMVGPVSASTTYSADKTPTVKTNEVNIINNKITIKGNTPDTLKPNDSVILQLPSNFKMSGTVVAFTYVGSDENDIVSISVNDGVYGNDIAFGWPPNMANKIKIKIVHVKDESRVPYIHIYIDRLEVPGGITGDIKLSMDTGEGFGFSKGEVVIAKTGYVYPGIDKVVPITGSGGTIDAIKIRETMAGDLKTGESLKFNLPNGFTWDISGKSIERIWGDLSNYNLYVIDNGRTLVFKVNKESTADTYLRISGLRININESTAVYGNVNVSISGQSSIALNSLTVARYDKYTAVAKKIETRSVQPGIRGQEIGKFAFEEEVPGTIAKGQTITLTLPDKVKWDGEYPSVSGADSTLQGFEISKFTLSGTDGRTIKATVTNSSFVNKAKIVFKGGKITAAVNCVGNITLKVGGTANVSGDVIVAEAKTPVTVTVSGKPEVKIGLTSQNAADIILSETNKETFKSLNYPSGDTCLTITTPSGVKFANAPKFEVTGGNLKLGTPVLNTNQILVSVKINATSSLTSTIKISNINLTIDRTVPEGEIFVKIGGSALIQNETIFPEVKWVAEKVIASCSSPKDSGEPKRTAVFKISEATYKVNNKDEIMDVAPYIKDGRVYLPVRYVGYALYVKPENILWSKNEKAVILLKGDRIVQVKIGSKAMIVTPSIVTMDVAPEIKSGRVMLPFKWIAQYGLGASVKWDSETKTVTMEL